MNKKTLLTLAIMLALPCATIAETLTIIGTNTPAPVTNGIVTRAANIGPYQITTIENDDSNHIASTAYVKGAYNDTIAGLNSAFRQLEDKQTILGINAEGEYIDPDVVGTEEFVETITAGDTENADKFDVRLVTAEAVGNVILNQRAEVWTTWDDDSAKTEVAFVTAQE